MTVSYQYEVASSTSGGFTRLLFLWRGSLYKLIYRELLLFILAFGLLSALYRLAFNDQQKKIFEKMVIYCDTFINLIPLSFVLGFYVAYVAGRWWQQYMAIPWPDKIMHSIALYVNGNDEHGRMVRRTLMRYLNLSLILVLRSISSAVKRRFPTLEHVVEAGFMTAIELEMYQSVPSVEFNTYWIPCTWFISLLKEARRTHRITDPQGLKIIMEEFNDFRSKCGLLWSYDWVSIPLVYTQVVTIATYSFFLAALVGRQYVDSAKKPLQMEIDIYIPVFTILQFFFFMGLLKVAEQLINPFGDDDEDFELNWIIDRHTKVSYLGVDTLMAKAPPLVKDMYFDDVDLTLPYTEASVSYKKKTYRGSVHNMQVPEEKHTMYLPEILEEDEEKTSPTRSSTQNLHKAPSMTGLPSPAAAGIWRAPLQFPKSFSKYSENNPEFETDSWSNKNLEMDTVSYKPIQRTEKGTPQAVRKKNSFATLKSCDSKGNKSPNSSPSALLSWPSSSTMGHSDTSLHYRDPSEDCSVSVSSPFVNDSKSITWSETIPHKSKLQLSDLSLDQSISSKKNAHSSTSSAIGGIYDTILHKKLNPSNLTKMKSYPKLIPVRRQSSSSSGKRKGVRWKPMIDNKHEMTGDIYRRRIVDSEPYMQDMYDFSHKDDEYINYLDKLPCKHCKHCVMCQRGLDHASCELGGFNVLTYVKEMEQRNLSQSAPTLLLTSQPIDEKRGDHDSNQHEQETRTGNFFDEKCSINSQCLPKAEVITTPKLAETNLKLLDRELTKSCKQFSSSDFLSRFARYERMCKKRKGFLLNPKCYSTPDFALLSKTDGQSLDCQNEASGLYQTDKNLSLYSPSHHTQCDKNRKYTIESEKNMSSVCGQNESEGRNDAGSLNSSTDTGSWMSADWSVLLKGKHSKSSEASIDDSAGENLTKVETEMVNLDEVVIDCMKQDEKST